MKKTTVTCFITTQIVAALLVFVGCAAGYADAPSTPAQAEIAAQAGRWEKEIQAFEERDKKALPPADAALFIGSSSIRLWSTLAQDFSEIPVINRGFGGSEIADSTQYVDRIVLPYKPRIVVMFAGGNDLSRGQTPTQVQEDFDAFVTKIHASLPAVPIAYISINPTQNRWKDRDKTCEANRLIADCMQGKDKLLFIDSYSKLLGADGKPQKALLREDGLHFNSEGYKAWTAIIKPSILKLYEAAKPKTAS